MLSAPVQPIHWNYNNASGVGRKYRVQRPTKVVPPPLPGEGTEGGTPPVQLGVTGERCKLPHRGLGRSPRNQRFLHRKPPKNYAKTVTRLVCFDTLPLRM